MSFPKYEAYKDSGVEWLGEVPEHWDVMPLKHLVSTPVTDGPHETPNFIDDGVLFISAEAVSSGKVDFTKAKYISREDHNRFSKKYKPQKHDIYMVKSGATTGVTAIVETEDEFNIWSPLAVIRCNQSHHPYFVLFSMRSRSFQESVVLHWSFGTQQNIGMSVIENLPITNPPLGEQTQIARFLDYETARIDALIAEQQRLIELLKEKRQAVISHAVTKGLDPTAPMKDSGVEWLGEVPAHWEVTPLKHLVSTPITDGPHETPEFVDDGVLFVSAEAVSSGEVDFTKARYISREDHNRFSKKYKPQNHDIFMVKSGATTGVTAIVETDDEFNIWSPLAVIRSNKHHYPYFVIASMRSLSFQESVALHWSFGTQQNIGMRVIENLPIASPPLEEQIKIAEFIHGQQDKWNSLITECKNAVSLLTERRSALISAAVTGKIDVRGWQAPASVAPAAPLEAAYG
ncbi:MAG TPA: restriction endonuclease subunit S [Candidatus Obscuribacterales bacterium]